MYGLCTGICTGICARGYLCGRPEEEGGFRLGDGFQLECRVAIGWPNTARTPPVHCPYTARTLLVGIDTRIPPPPNDLPGTGLEAQGMGLSLQLARPAANPIVYGRI